MHKLSAYVDIAATDYLRETDKIELDPRWTAEFCDEAGVLEDFPGVDVVAFHAQVQKALIVKAGRAEKEARHQIGKRMETGRGRNKP